MDYDDFLLENSIKNLLVNLYLKRVSFVNVKGLFPIGCYELKS